MKNFEVEWKALKERKQEDPPEVPKITKLCPIIKWMETFQDFLNHKISNCMMSLATIKTSIGKTGVHLRYHCHHEYHASSKVQMQELTERCKNNPDGHEAMPNTKKQRKPLNKKLSKHIASLINQQVENETKKLAPSQNTSANNDEAYLLSMVEATW